MPGDVPHTTGPSPTSRADPARIEACAHALSVAAARLDSDSVSLASGVRAVLASWRGDAASAFRAYAASTDASRLAASSALRSAAARLRAHADAVAACTEGRIR